MKKQLTRIVLAASLAFTVWSCNQSDPVAKGDFVSGVFVINEGNFSQNNGSISFFPREESTAETDVFAKINGSAFKGGVQGYAVSGEKGIILVDNSAAGLDKVEIVNSNTFKSEGTIGAPDIENPREVVFSNSSTAYVTCWGTTGVYPDFFINPGYIAVIDLATNKVTKKISVAKGVENIVYNNGKLFVGTVNYSGINSLTAISTSSNEIVKEMTFDSSPAPIGTDADGKLWVQDGLKLLRLNADTYAIEATLTITNDATKSAGNFAFSLDKRTIFFVLSYYDADYVTHGETYKVSIADTQVNVTTPLIKRNFSGLAVDPLQGLIYAGVNPSYAQSGYAVRYRTDGTLVDSIKVGIAPTGFFFR